MKAILEVLAVAVVVLALFIAGAAVKVAMDARNEAKVLAAQIRAQTDASSKISDGQVQMIGIVDDLVRNQKGLLDLHMKLSKRVDHLEGSTLNAAN